MPLRAAQKNSFGNKYFVSTTSTSTSTWVHIPAPVSNFQVQQDCHILSESTSPKWPSWDIKLYYTYINIYCHETSDLRLRYLPGRRASPPFGRYQIILLGNSNTCTWTTSPGSLSKVASDLLIASPAPWPLRHRTTHYCDRQQTGCKNW